MMEGMPVVVAMGQYWWAFACVGYADNGEGVWVTRVSITL